jgi:hypothetical protein
LSVCSVEPEGGGRILARDSANLTVIFFGFILEVDRELVLAPDHTREVRPHTGLMQASR